MGGDVIDHQYQWLRAPKVVIIDDHRLLRQGMRLILESRLGVAVVGEYCAILAVDRTVETSPDAVIITVDSPNVESRLESVRQIRSALPDVRVIVLGEEPPDLELNRQAVDAGASGYLSMEQDDVDTMLDIIVRTLDDSSYSKMDGSRLAS